MNANPTTAQLQRCFELIFKIEGVTPEDDFFELGGDSLAAAQLLVEIEKRIGVKIPSTVLIQSPTVSALAVAIEQGMVDQFKATIVPFKESGNLPPIYMTHGHRGDLWVAHNLAPHLGQDHPLYGIVPNVNDANFHNLQELAKRNVEVLIAEHPRQDYRLIGYSFGGILAYEMARQLQASGHGVSFLGIIDSRPNLGPDLRRHVRPDHREGWARLKERYRQKGLVYTLAWFAQWLHRKFQNQRTTPEQAEEPDLRSAFEQKAENAFFEHVPGAYSGDVTFFFTNQDPLAVEPERGNCWSEFTTGKVEQIPVEGDHESISKSPHIKQIAARLNKLV